MGLVCCQVIWQYLSSVGMLLYGSILMLKMSGWIRRVAGGIGFFLRPPGIFGSAAITVFFLKFLRYSEILKSSFPMHVSLEASRSSREVCWKKHVHGSVKLNSWLFQR